MFVAPKLQPATPVASLLVLIRTMFVPDNPFVEIGVPDVYTVHVTPPLTLNESLSAYRPVVPPDPPEKVAETFVPAQTAIEFGVGATLFETKSA